METWKWLLELFGRELLMAAAVFFLAWLVASIAAIGWACRPGSKDRFNGAAIAYAVFWCGPVGMSIGMFLYGLAPVLDVLAGWAFGGPVVTPRWLAIPISALIGAGVINRADLDQVKHRLIDRIPFTLTRKPSDVSPRDPDDAAGTGDQ